MSEKNAKQIIEQPIEQTELNFDRMTEAVRLLAGASEQAPMPKIAHLNCQDATDYLLAVIEQLKGKKPDGEAD